jgi:ketosteroid isomerase-like protein
MSEEFTSPDLVPVVRQVFKAYSSGDLDRIMSFFAPDAVVSPYGGLGDLEGEVQIRSLLEVYLGSFEDLRFEPEEILSLGSRVVFAVVHQDARPLGSAARVRSREGWGAAFCDAKIVRAWTSSDIDTARAATERFAESSE